MKILLVADEECPALWDFYRPERMQGVDLILSAGDLKAEYLEFLVTMCPVELGYVHGNHDTRYDRRPPEGCVCLDDTVQNMAGLRILGLGGSMRYCPGKHQYSEQEMDRRIRRLKPKLRKSNGVDIVLAHAPAKGFGDAEDIAHQGFTSFLSLMDTYHPKYFIHGHVHTRYGVNIPRVQQYGETTIINCCERFILEI